MPEDENNVVWAYDPSGRIEKIRRVQLDDAIRQGWSLPKSEDQLFQDKYAQDLRDEQQGAMGQVGGFLEGTLSGVTLGASDLAAAASSDPEQLARMKARRDTTAGQAGEVVGTVVPALVSGGAAAPAGAAAKGAAALGKLAAKPVANALGTGARGRIAAKGVELGVEGGLSAAYQQAAANVSDASLGDEELTVEKVLADVPEATGYGLALGAALGVGTGGAGQAARKARELRIGDVRDSAEELTAGLVDPGGLPFADEAAGVMQAAKGAKLAGGKIRNSPLMDKAVDGYVDIVGGASGATKAQRRILKETLKSPNARKDFLARDELKREFAERAKTSVTDTKSANRSLSEAVDAAESKLKARSAKAAAEAEGEVIYRATDSGYSGKWSNWTPEPDTAKAYTEKGVGHGGPKIIEGRATGDMLDIASRETGVDFETLADELYYDDPVETARSWRDNGWRYPWEESKEVANRLEESNWDWIKYYDDYPEGATTYVRVSDSGLTEATDFSSEMSSLLDVRNAIAGADDLLDDMLEKHGALRSADDADFKASISSLDDRIRALDSAAKSGTDREVAKAAADAAERMRLSRAAVMDAVERIAPTNALDDLVQQESQGFFGQYPMAAALGVGLVGGPTAYIAARGVNTLAKPATLARQIGVIESLTDRVGRVDKQISKALQFVLRSPSADAGRVSGFKAPRVSSAVPALLSRDKEKQQKSYKRISRNITQLANDPKQATIAVERITSGVTDVSPSMAAVIGLKHARTVKYLDSQLPKPPAYMRSKRERDAWSPTSSEIETFARKYRAVTDPMSVLADMRDGTLTMDAVEALRATRPKFWQDLRQKAMLEIYESKEPITYSATVQLSVLFGFAGDSTMSPEFLQMQAQRWAEREQEQPPAQPQGGPAPDVSGQSTNLADEIVASL